MKEYNAITQVTREEAIDIAKSKIWKKWTDEEIVKFQLFQDRLCVDFSTFHKAMEKVLNRPIFSHEFADQDRLIDEYLGKREKPTMEEIINMFPKDKTILLVKAT